MTLSTEETSALVVAFTDRLASINDREDCAHVAFPEVTDNDALMAVMEQAADDVIQLASLAIAGVIDMEYAVKALEHGFIVTAAFALAYGGVESVKDSTAPTDQEWHDYFDSLDVESLPTIDPDDGPREGFYLDSMEAEREAIAAVDSPDDDTTESGTPESV